MAYKFNPLTGKLDEYGPILTGTGTVSAAADGTAALPGIAFTNDLNTGIYRPGADQVAISTGGTGRLFVDASGNIGVGTNSIQAALDVQGTNFDLGNPLPGFASGNFPTFRIATNDSTRLVSFQQLYGGDNTLKTFYSYTGIDHIWQTANALERMRLDASGRLGIGTVSPDVTLHLGITPPSTGSTGVIGFGDLGGFRMAEIEGVREDGSYAGSIIFRTQPQASFGFSGQERLRITSAGLVGIGTNAPSTKLEISGSEVATNFVTATTTVASGWSGFRVRNTDIFGRSFDIAVGGNTAPADQANKLYVYDNTANTQRITLDSSGRLGIGTTSPSTALHVVNPTGQALFEGSVQGGITIQKAGTLGINLYSDAAGTLVFYNLNGNTERARIDSSGRLLVGTATARANIYGISAGIQLEGAANNTFRNAAQIYGKDNAEGPLYTFAKHRSASVGGQTVVSSGDELGQIVFTGSDGTSFIQGATIKTEVDGTPGVNDMPGRLLFLTTPDGAASPQERMRITSDAYVRLASGTGGIQFNGDTAAANALDDYEEGTWTPTIVGSSTAGTGTYTVQSGRYTKVGRSVYAAGTVIWSAHDGTGNIRITGLPFVSLNISELTNAISFTYVSDITIPANSIPVGGVFPNNSYVTLYSMAVAGGTPSALGMDGSGTIYFSLTYQTA